MPEKNNSFRAAVETLRDAFICAVNRPQRRFRVRARLWYILALCHKKQSLKVSNSSVRNVTAM